MSYNNKVITLGCRLNFWESDKINNLIQDKENIVVFNTCSVTNEAIKNAKRKNFSVISNPEFLREGDAINDFFFPDRIVIGTSDKRTNILMHSLYAPLLSKGAKYLNSSRRGAELIKYASNAFLATKITFINELANLSEKIGVNIEDISIGMGLDKRIGGRFLRAGPAYGGSCFPKDTRAIVDTAKEFKTDLSIIKNVIEIFKVFKVKSL